MVVLPCLHVRSNPDDWGFSLSVVAHSRGGHAYLVHRQERPYFTHVSIDIRGEYILTPDDVKRWERAASKKKTKSRRPTPPRRTKMLKKAAEADEEDEDMEVEEEEKEVVVEEAAVAPEVDFKPKAMAPHFTLLNPVST